VFVGFVGAGFVAGDVIGVAIGEGTDFLIGKTKGDFLKKTPAKLSRDWKKLNIHSYPAFHILYPHSLHDFSCVVDIDLQLGHFTVISSCIVKV